MAVLNDVPGIQVSVRVKGQLATEYPDPDPDQQQPTENDCPVVCSYIESFDNRHFAIVTNVSQAHDFSYKNHALTFRIYVDGKCAVRSCTREDQVRNGLGHLTFLGPWTLDRQGKNLIQQKFKFATVKRVEDDHRDRVRRDKDRARDLGVIEVRVFRTILRGVGEFQTRTLAKKRKLEFSEKALKGKAISHGVSYGEPVATSLSNQSLVTDDISEDGGPIAVYRFLYRSREALKQELIIPRSPSPPSSLDGHESVQNQYWRRELAELRALVELLGENLKREHDEVPDIANNPQERPPKRSRIQERRVEVIDLTEDHEIED